jgi:hypothetical protein
VVTRRALLAGGAVLLAGCGKDLASEPQLPAPDEVLSRQLAAERALEAALAEMDGSLADRLGARSAARARRIAAAAGGSSEATSEPRGPALEQAQATLAEHVEALPALRARRLRRLGTDLVVETATDLAVLGAVLEERPAEAFPGTPV